MFPGLIYDLSELRHREMRARAEQLRRGRGPRPPRWRRRLRAAIGAWLVATGQRLQSCEPRPPRLLRW